MLEIVIAFLLLGSSHGEKHGKSGFKYNDPNTWNMTLPESILQYLDFIDFDDVASMIFRNMSVFDDEKCNEDYLSIYQDLRQNYQWPKIFLDGEISTIEHGLFEGHRLSLGNYDECLSIKPPNRNFTGKYCLIYLNDTNDPFDFNARGITTLRRPLLYIGTCLPSTCSAKYLNRLVKEFKLPHSKEPVSDAIEIGVFEEDCHTIDEHKDFTTLNWITLCILGILTACLIFSSLYDIWRRKVGKTGKPIELFLAFSIPSNLPKILNTNQSSRNAAISGIRAITALYIVFCHSYYTPMNMHNMNLRYALLSVDSSLFGFQMINHGTTATDTFLILAGILVVFSFFNEVKRRSQYDPGSAFIKRYIRLMAPIALLVLLRMGISEHLFTGPIYTTMNNFVRKGCDGHLWSYFLLYNNFVQITTEMCLQHVWYITLDLQLFAACQFVLIVALWNPKKLPQIACFVAWAAAITEFIIADINDLGTMPSIDRTGDMLKVDYHLPHTRAAAWFTGMFFGYLLYYSNKKPLKISKVQAGVAWILCGLLLFVSIYPLALFDRNYEQPWSAFYLAFHRITWGLGIGLFVVLCGTNHGRLLNDILSWAPFNFYGNIAYELFLIHQPTLEFMGSTTKNTIYMSYNRVWYQYFMVLPYATFGAIVLALVVTAPCNIIIQLYMKNLKVIPLKNHCEEHKIVKAEA